MVEVHITQVFVPQADNSGRPFSDRLFDQTEIELRSKFNGLTVWGEVQGQWVAPSGRLDLDAHRVYEIAHPGRERVWWERFKDTLRVRFAQEEIWILQSSSGWKVI